MIDDLIPFEAFIIWFLLCIITLVDVLSYEQISIYYLVKIWLSWSSIFSDGLKIKLRNEDFHTWTSCQTRDSCSINFI